jgi:hypothetical protein
MTIQEFKQHLNVKELPKELEMLIEFQNNSGFENYSEGFGLYQDDLKHWSTDPGFLDSIKAFAQANGTGSTYAFWEDEKEKSLDNMPIIVFGDEGGIHVVAENLLQLMHLLSFDAEISVDHEEVYFYKDEDEHEGTDDHETYCEWLKENFNLDELTDTSKIINKAQENYKAKFDAWVKLYVK